MVQKIALGSKRGAFNNVKIFCICSRILGMQRSDIFEERIVNV